MANDPQNPTLQDILNNATAGFAGLPSDVPAPLMSAAAPWSPTGSPAGPVYAASVAPKPTLGTNAELQAPANEAATSQTDDSGAAPSSITLPARNSSNSTSPEEVRPGFLQTLGQFAKGAAGINGPLDTPAEKGAAFTHILSRVGSGLAMAAGTPEQKQIGEEQAQMPLKLAQIQNENLYRQALMGNNANKTAIAAKTEQDKYATGDAANGLPPGTTRQMAEVAQQKADTEARLAKIKENQMNGEVEVTPEAAEAAGRKDLAGKSLGALAYQQQVTNPITNQLKASGGTKTVDLGADGVYGYSALTNKLHRLGDSPSVARGNAMLLRTQIPETDAQGNVVAFLNPQTRTRTPVSSIGGAGGAEGVIPPKPTSSMLTMGQMAQTIQAQVPALKQEIADLGDKVGAAGGRWNDFWVKKAGVNDPAYAGVDQDLQLYATALGKAHFGASMPEGFVKDMMHDFSMAQSPEDLQSRIDHAEGWVNGYAARIGGNRAGSPDATKPLTAQEAADYLQKAGGDKDKARAAAKKDNRSF